MHFNLSKKKKKNSSEVSAVHYVLQSHKTVFLIQLDAFIQTAND